MTNNKSKNKNWGGVRSGAGRPKGSENVIKPITRRRLSVPEPIADAVERIVFEYKELHKKLYL